ncbi:Uncharacterised protein [Mycobacteroides abscessus subsp. abscessus]|nr:Uncharacterised protein [Mycobacteroides abscessus subsp. abscessus]
MLPRRPANMYRPCPIPGAPKDLLISTLSAMRDAWPEIESGTEAEEPIGSVDDDA